MDIKNNEIIEIKIEYPPTKQVIEFMAPDSVTGGDLIHALLQAGNLNIDPDQENRFSLTQTETNQLINPHLTLSELALKQQSTLRMEVLPTPFDGIDSSVPSYSLEKNQNRKANHVNHSSFSALYFSENQKVSKDLQERWIDGLAVAKTGEVIESILNYCKQSGDQNLLQNILEISNRWHSLNRDILSTQITYSDFEVGVNKLSKRLISLISGLETQS